jgi:hypothetical protein
VDDDDRHSTYFTKMEKEKTLDHSPYFFLFFSRSSFVLTRLSESFTTTTQKTELGDSAKLGNFNF